MQVANAVEPIESATFAVKLNEPVVVGVPVIAPDDELSVRPGGRLPETIENVYGDMPPLATSADEYGTPTWPFPLGHASVRHFKTVTFCGQVLLFPQLSVAVQV